jgi:glycosyltransferase involved in cell wall biosynthesis
MSGGPVFFYSGWRLGYHNLEAERKARALAAAGYDVTYVAGLGIRNPDIANLRVHAGRIGRILAARRSRHEAGPSGDESLRLGSAIVMPPRQLELVRRCNARWLARQLRSQSEPWSETLAWVRWPTPEVVEALTLLSPMGTVYECVDAYDHTPGIVGRWASIFARYERELVERADVVVVPGEQLAQRFRAWGADVRIVPHGVDLIEWRWREPRTDSAAVVGFVGTLDYRLDVPVLRAIAQQRPQWRIRLIGPVQAGFDPTLLSDLDNVSIEPPIPAEEVPGLIASFDLGVMPYIDHPVYAFMTPLKCLEFLAAGLPTVARPSAALEPYGELLYFADSPQGFVTQLERALAEQSQQRAQARRSVAEENGWPRRLAQTTAIADELTAGPPTREQSGP